MTAGPGQAWDEIGFLAFELGCDRKAAMEVWLKEAGVWEERCQEWLVASDSAADANEPGRPDATAEPPALMNSEGKRGTSERNPLVAFYEALTLSDADREELRVRRGLSDEAIDAAGFRTNCRENLEILLALAKEFSEAELIRCGLWRSKGKEAKPNAQFYGYGVIGKKKKLSPELLESGDSHL